jgi:RimJ/RimL family protein N-acetyltransferase
MGSLNLLPITPADDLTSVNCSDQELLASVTESCLSLYDAAGFQLPWICYFAEQEHRVVGTCGFKGPPRDGAVEIAYFTFPGEESKGIATSMAQLLLNASRQANPDLRVTAQTLVDRNASHRILEKLGFHITKRLHHPEDGDVLEWELATSACGQGKEGDEPCDAPERR